MNNQASQEKQTKKEVPLKKKQVNEYARYSGMAVQMGIIIGLFAFAGQWLDGYFGTARPYWTTALALLGVGVALYTLLKDLVRDK